MAALLAAAFIGTMSCGGTSTLVSITVMPSNSSVVNGSTMQFIATATFSNGMTISPWSVVNWSSSNAGVATIATNGAVTTVSPGMTVITATDVQHPELFSQATLTVTNMPLVALSAAADNPVLARGATTQMRAAGTYADGTSNDLTSSVIWSSSNAGVASISNTQGSNGLVTTFSAGTITITAIELFTGISAETVLIVTP